MLAPNTEIEAALKSGAPRGLAAIVRRPIFWIAVVAALAAIGIYWWSASSSTTTISYTTSAVKRGDLTTTVTATGTVEPVDQVDVSSELSGTVSEVLADYNDTVKAGQVIARINTDKLTAQTNSIRAELEAARASVAEAEATVAENAQTLERTTALAARSVATQKDLDAANAAHNRAVAALASAKAQVKVKEASLAAYETDLTKAEIKSPINGVILDRKVNPGSTVAASLSAPTLFTIAEDLRKMKVEVDVDEADAGTVKEGQDATFTVEAFPDRTFNAKVIQLRYASTTTNDVVTYTGVLSVDNSDLAIRPGMTATADIVVEHVANALIVPNAALRYAPASAMTTTAKSGGWLQNLMPRPPRRGAVSVNKDVPAGQKRLWVLKDGAPQAVLVTTGSGDGSSTAILSGELAEGDQVITDEIETK
jgi:HlyD family secretion protein